MVGTASLGHLANRAALRRHSGAEAKAVLPLVGRGSERGSGLVAWD